MSSQRLRLPFVVTMATASACGGNAVIDGQSGTGGASSSTSGNATASNGATTVTGSSGVGTPVNCPATPPTGYDQCDSTSTCHYDVACQSGQVALSFTCTDGWWTIVPTPCDEPYDSCPGTEYYCDDSWWMPAGTNPPSPCPEVPPPPGQMCFTGGMGGVWEFCGYRCEPGPNAKWTVAQCVMAPTGGSWVYDGVCN